MKADKSEEIKRRIANKRKCAYAMKRLNIRIFVIATIILCAWCIVLLAKIRILDGTLQTVTLQLNEMNGVLQEQQRLLEELNQGINNFGEGMLHYESNSVDSPEGMVEVPEQQESEAADVVEKEPEHKVYLTFDDGPSIYTDDILDILDQYNVKATFFVVGKDNDTAKDFMRQIVERGHSLGMHSYSHDYTTLYDSVDIFAEDFTKLQNHLYEVTGVKSTLYRFPGGSSNTVSEIGMQQFADYLQGQGVTFYDWNISSGDGSSVEVPVEDLVNNCTKDIQNWKTSIILLHDSADKTTTVEALPSIIENILAMEDTVILPITEETKPVQHINQ